LTAAVVVLTGVGIVTRYRHEGGSALLLARPVRTNGWAVERLLDRAGRESTSSVVVARDRGRPRSGAYAISVGPPYFVRCHPVPPSPSAVADRAIRTETR
jgi:hypothetical protein